LYVATAESTKKSSKPVPTILGDTELVRLKKNTHPTSNETGNGCSNVQTSKNCPTRYLLVVLIVCVYL
jgi:hypothetical protein